MGLGGLTVDDGRALLRDKLLAGDAAAWQGLVERYGGNGLALKVIGESIRELFGGGIAEYLADVPAGQGLMIGGIRRLLTAQMERLSDLERRLLRQLAVHRERVSLTELATELSPTVGRAAVLEHVTEALIYAVTQELLTRRLDWLMGQALLTATAEEYVRRGQERFLLAPILDRLVANRGSQAAAEQWLRSMLAEVRQRPPTEHGYGPGNLVNLLRVLRGDLRGLNLSRLSIRQAYLQDVEVQDASLAGSHLVEAVLAEGFNYPTQVALSPDGAYLAAGTSTGEVCPWASGRSHPDRHLARPCRRRLGCRTQWGRPARGQRQLRRHYQALGHR
jgi:hypothetical protein